MRKEATVTKEYLECDGCQYGMAEKDPRIEITVPYDFEWEALRSDPPETLMFHFHAVQTRHDCFRYWAHSPHVMKRSLRERGLDAEQIDDFMSLMLYREGLGPGIERPKEKAAS